MNDWLYEFISVVERSKRTQLAIVMSLLMPIVILLVGSFLLSDFEMAGPLKGLQDAIVQRLADRYEFLAFGTFISFLVVAYKCYQKDKKRRLS